jgi:hypothetical protein
MNVFEDLTTYDQVRYAAGVSSQELSDDELLAFGLDDELSLNLYQWLPDGTTAESIFTNRLGTPVQARSFLALAAYSKYWCAHALFITGRLRFATKISDSENSMARAEWNDEEKVATLLGQCRRYRTMLLESLGETVDETPAFDIAGISAPAYDPVTNA